MDSAPNLLLRDHVTSAAFVLSLGKTHVAALVRLDLELAAEVHIRPPCEGQYGRLYRNDIAGVNGLIARGLIVHVYEQNLAKHNDHDRIPPGQIWNITRAGRLVCDLLREAGLYQEFAGPLLPLIEAQRERRAV